MDDNKAITKQVASGTKLESIGTVKTVIGTVKAVDQSGAERILQAGDKVFANETIITAADGLVLIEFKDGSQLDLPKSTQITLDTDVFSPDAPKSEELSDDQIQEMIAAGIDPTTITEAAAAGAGAGDEGSSSFIDVSFLNSQGNVTSGYDTTGIPTPEFTTLEELPPVIETALPQVSVVIIPPPPGEGEPPIVIHGTVADVVEGTQFVPGEEGQVPATKPITFTFLLTDADGNPFPLVHDPVTVTYHLADGTAIYGEDYIDGGTGTHTITIPSGTNTYDVTVNIVEDGVTEPDQTFSIILDSATGATIGTSTFTVNIINDDFPTITVGDPRSETGTGDITVPEGTDAVFLVTVTGAAAGSTVTLSLADGTALTGADYDGVKFEYSTDGGSTWTAVTGAIGVATGDSTLLVRTDTVDDTVYETDETFTLNATLNSLGTDYNASAQATIIDNDAPPSFSINDVTVNEADGTITFTVTKTGLTALASSVDYNVAPNSALTPADYTAGSSALAGTLNFAAGETTQTITLNITDDAVSELTENFNVNLSNSVNATISDAQGVGTITDNDAAPSFSINDVTVNEADGTITFTVTKTGLTALASSVDYNVAPNSALTPADYTAGSSALAGTLNFAAGETSQTITLNITDDAVSELTENFNVNLSNSVNATISDAQGVGTITDDDAPTVSISDGVPNPATEGTDASITFTVTLSNAADHTMTVAYTTVNGTAVAGSDYTTTSGTVTFLAGETVAFVTVPVLDDSVFETPEAFTVELGATTGGVTVADGSGIGNIADNDAPPSFSINDVTVTEGTNPTITFTVTLTGATTLTSTVNYSVAAGTATTPGDYTAGTSALSGMLTFAPGETTKTITLNVTNDTVVEPTETFTVNLSAATNATISDAQGVGTILDNDVPPPNILDGVMKTNSNVTNQFMTLSFVDQNDPTHAAAKIYDLNLQGQQGVVLQDVGFNIDPNLSYLVTAEASAGTKAIITDFSLEGVTIQGSGNAQLELNDTSATNSTSTAITAVINPDDVATPIYDGVLVEPKAESIDGDAAANTLTDSTASTFNYLYGAGGNDTLNGSGGSEVLNGGTGVDTLNGNGGNDILVYDSVDHIDGGTGFDLLRVDQGALQLSQAGSSNSSNTLGPSDNVTVDLQGKDIHNIEGILITEEAGASTLAVDPNDNVGTTIVLSAQDVFNYTDSDHTLYVMGSPGDKLDLDPADGWTTSGTPDANGFVQYTATVSSVTVTLLVEDTSQVQVI